MYSVKVVGFKTQEEAKQFIKWYEGQGEQDISIWLECRKSEDLIDIRYLDTDCSKTYPIKFDENNEATLYLKGS